MNVLPLLRELARLKRNEKRSRAQMRRLQEQKLRIMLHYAWDHSAFYRRTFQAAGIARAQLDTLPLAAFPSIDKAVLMEHFDELITVSDVTQADLRAFDRENAADRRPLDGRYHVVHSSGSTGTPCYFLYDQAAWNTMLTGIVRGALWGMRMPRILKLLLGRPRVMYVAATDGRYGGAMAVGDGIDGVGARQMYLDIKMPLSQWIRQVKAFRPQILIGYPSAIKILAELAQRGEVELQVLRVISCGEPLSPNLRAYLEQVFAAPVINIYGASESLALGVETGGPDGMLLFDDLNVIEVENGQMYLTCLYNFAQPLIRYRLSDRLVLKEAADTPFSCAGVLLGRSEDLLWFENDRGERDFLHPLAVEGFCIEGLRDYQFRPTGAQSFEMLAEVSGEAARQRVKAEMLRQMRAILNEKGLGYVRFSVQFADEILPDFKTGKKPLIRKGCTLQKEVAI